MQFVVSDKYTHGKDMLSLMVASLRLGNDSPFIDLSHYVYLQPATHTWAQVPLECPPKSL